MINEILKYNKEFVADIISKEFEPLLKKIATMFYAYSCDVILCDVMCIEVIFLLNCTFGSREG